MKLFPFEFARISKQIQKTSCTFPFSLFSWGDDEAEVVSKSSVSELPHPPGRGVVPLHPIPPYPSHSISLHVSAGACWSAVAGEAWPLHQQWDRVFEVDTSQSHNTLLSLSCSFCAHTYIFYFTVNIRMWRDTVSCILESFPWLCCSDRVLRPKGVAVHREGVLFSQTTGPTSGIWERPLWPSASGYIFTSWDVIFSALSL